MKKVILSLVLFSIFENVVAMPTPDTTKYPEYYPPYVNGVATEGWSKDGRYWAVPEGFQKRNMTSGVNLSKRAKYTFNIDALFCNYADTLKNPADRARAADRFCGQVQRAQLYELRALADMVTNEAFGNNLIAHLVTEIVMDTAQRWVIGPAIKENCPHIFNEIFAECGQYEGFADISNFDEKGQLTSKAHAAQIIRDSTTTCKNVAQSFPVPNECSASNW